MALYKYGQYFVKSADDFSIKRTGREWRRHTWHLPLYRMRARGCRGSGTNTPSTRPPTYYCTRRIRWRMIAYANHEPQ